MNEKQENHKKWRHEWEPANKKYVSEKLRKWSVWKGKPGKWYKNERSKENHQLRENVAEMLTNDRTVDRRKDQISIRKTRAQEQYRCQTKLFKNESKPWNNERWRKAGEPLIGEKEVKNNISLQRKASNWGNKCLRSWSVWDFNLWPNENWKKWYKPASYLPYNTKRYKNKEKPVIRENVFDCRIENER